MHFISHLDLLRMIQRALRRAGLKLDFSEGFHPHPRIYFQRALKLGILGQNEQMHIVLIEKLKPDILKLKLEKQLPDGIYLKKVALVE
jgi:radical SAM-linked protein